MRKAVQDSLLTSRDNRGTYHNRKASQHRDWQSKDAHDKAVRDRVQRLARRDVTHRTDDTGFSEGTV